MAEDKRRKDLRLFFNREDARRAKIMAEADSEYQKWLNVVLTKMAIDAEKESFDVVYDTVNLKNKINAKVKWRNSMIEQQREITGNGNTVE